jgi:EAL domain-containing protein (putative c-di-GMP-specific phosphodiesterase class I)
MLRSVAAIFEDPATPVDVRVWINLSPRELEVASFAARFSDAVAAAGVPPERVGLEITETAAVRDPAALAVELAEVRRSGVKIAIDDFGTGYSSLGFLRDLPVDVVKLDRSLIANIDSDAANQHLVRGIVGMLDELGIDITAEGVERIEEESWLANHGVVATQGFLRGRPVASSQLDWTARLDQRSVGAVPALRA